MEENGLVNCFRDCRRARPSKGSIFKAEAGGEEEDFLQRRRIGMCRIGRLSNVRRQVT